MRRRLKAPTSFVGLSFLVTRAVLPKTVTEYQKAVFAFLAWCSRRRCRWASDLELDAVLLNFGDEEFFNGKSVEVLSKLVAALRHFIPALRKGGTAALPRSFRAMTAWRKLAPGRQRLPLPRIILMALIGAAIKVFAGYDLAAKWLTMFNTYVRPGEADSLRWKQLVPPAAVAG